MIGQSRCSSCCMRVPRVTKNVPGIQPGAGVSGVEVDLLASVLAPPCAAIVEDVRAPRVLEGRCLESCLFSRSFLSDSFFPPPLLAKGLALQDCLGDLLRESLLCGAGGCIGKVTYCGAYLARDGNGLRLAPCLGNARAVRRWLFQGAASKIRCSTDASRGPRR